MLRVLVIIVVALSLTFATGCKSSGSREFIPGKGWVPND
jgi:hypothetical protein